MIKLHRQKGVAAVELALIVVPMLVLCFGIVEVGRALYYYNGLVKATRSAARYLTTKDLNAISSTKADAIAAAQNLAVCGTTTTCTSATQLVPGLTDPVGQVAVTTNNNVLTGNGSVSLVTVTISGVSFTPFLPHEYVSYISRFGFTYSDVKLTMAWSVT